MNILRAIALAFSRPSLPENPEETGRESDRRIVSRFARGNIRLQQGKFSTREELDERRRQVKAYDFGG